MVRLIPALVVTGFTLLLGSAAHAELAETTPRLRLALFAEPSGGEMPAPTESAPPPPPGEKPPAQPVGSLEEEGSVKPVDLSYGLATQLRWVSVPTWLLNLFTVRNVPLSSVGFTLQGFRRKGDFDFVVSVGYQNMSPSDGNWLGKDHDPAIDTDYVQFRNLSLLTFDASFVWHNWFSQSFGMHYGAGLGLGVVFGSLLRTSNAGCTATNAGNVTQCHPLNVDCSSGVCNEAQLAATSARGGEMVDSAATPSRFKDGNVPGAVPIVNVMLGVDFRLPQVPGWELKLEGGFYDAFFLGGGIVYKFL
jgi:hypothetical protein